MPIHNREDAGGPYFQWGEHGKKYYYKHGDAAGKADARDKAGRQARAAYAHGYKGGS